MEKVQQGLEMRKRKEFKSRNAIDGEVFQGQCLNKYKMYLQPLQEVVNGPHEAVVQVVLN